MIEESSLLVKIGSRIKQLRKEKEVRQVDLAFNIDMDDGSLRRIERGQANLTVKTLEKIARGLDVPMKDLFDF